MSPLIASLIIWDKYHKAELPQSQATKLIEILQKASTVIAQNNQSYTRIENTFQIPEVEYAQKALIATYMAQPVNEQPRAAEDIISGYAAYIRQISAKNSWDQTIYLEDLIGLNKFCPFEIVKEGDKKYLAYAHYLTFEGPHTYKLNFKMNKGTIQKVKFNNENIEALKVFVNYLQNVKDPDTCVADAYDKTFFDFGSVHYPTTTLGEVKTYLTNLLAKLETKHTKAKATPHADTTTTETI